MASQMLAGFHGAALCSPRGCLLYGQGPDERTPRSWHDRSRPQGRCELQRCRWHWRYWILATTSHPPSRSSRCISPQILYDQCLQQRDPDRGPQLNTQEYQTGSSIGKERPSGMTVYHWTCPGSTAYILRRTHLWEKAPISTYPLPIQTRQHTSHPPRRPNISPPCSSS